ncbi:hypothetical protein AWC38_SpisGene17496 [Stylophora pistillata]|uniref:Tropomyosin n=1 Tax=Stylophora pistillata TaxID=50429 RepID=A0A2B4RPF8_STYPI|nr:hypothetical protein AWC38_SpisGene17496 [Stylophora pistillata]
MSSLFEDVKNKMIAIKAKTEEAVEREHVASSQLKKQKLEIASKDDEAAGYRRHIEFLRKKLEETLVETDVKGSRLKELNDKADAEAVKGRELTYAEVETDEQLRELEHQDMAVKRVEELEDMIRKAGENLRKLEQEDVRASERETDSQQKIQILEEELKARIEKCEDTERLETTKLRLIDDLTTDIEFWNSKKLKLLNEIDALEHMD